MGNPRISSVPSEQRAFVSLASRLALIIFALAASVSLLVAFELARRERGHYVESKRRAGEMLTELFANSMVPALDFADAEAVSSSLDMLSQNGEVVDAVVWATDDRAPLARLARKQGSPGLRGRPAPGVRTDADYIDIVRAVQSPTGNLLGKVAVRVSLASENAAFAAGRRRIFWLAFGLSGVVAGLLVAVLRRTIISPLAQLEKAARRLALGELTLVLDLRNDEIGSLGRTFNRMGRAIGEREEHIYAMNARLQGLLDNMRQAILVFEGDGSLCVERSKLARQLFGDATGPETSVINLLYPLDRASEVERDAFRVWLAAASEGDEHDFEELGELAPREAILPRADAEDLLLELEFRRAPGEGEGPRFMLLATDVTSQRKLERTAEVQARHHQKQLTAMRRLLAGGGQVFVRFLGSARERLGKAERQLSEADQLTPDVVEHVFRFVHTLRAEARSLDLEQIEALVSDLEVELSGARHAPPDSVVRTAMRQTLRAGLSRLSVELNQAEELFVQTSPIGRRVLEQVTVSRQDVEELFRRLGGEKNELGKLAARLAARPFGELLSTLPEATDRWTGREGKKLELVVSGREALVPAPLCERLSGVLAHLLRNAVAHGIETPAERQAQNKAESGRIELSCQESVEGVIVQVTDDGAGFDVDALRREAVERGHAGDGDVDLAFIAGLSTRQIQDDLAGHGVGMGAVRDELAQVGYVVRISSRAGRGARIVIEPARPLPARNMSEASALTEVARE